VKAHVECRAAPEHVTDESDLLIAEDILRAHLCFRIDVKEAENFFTFVYVGTRRLEDDPFKALKVWRKNLKQVDLYMV
jgi:hypothetical protein